MGVEGRSGAAGRERWCPLGGLRGGAPLRTSPTSPASAFPTRRFSAERRGERRPVSFETLVVGGMPPLLISCRGESPARL